MKKLVSILLACMLTFSLAGCGKKASSGNGDVAVKDAVGALTTVWESYSDDNKFAAMGGNATDPKMDEPGAVEVSDDVTLHTVMIVPDDAIAMIDDAANLFHAMNANTFTGSAFHLKDSKDAKAFVDSYKENLMSHQWMCGFPEIFVAAQVGDDYIVTAYGNGEMVDYFKEQVTKTYGNAEILAEENF